MTLSHIIPSALFLLAATSAAPLTTPALNNSPLIAGRASSCAPGGLFDLSIFTLQLPTGSNGKVDSISSSKLSGCNGWQSKDYFYADDGVLVTKVPSRSNCVTTTNSKHCRTELRESNPNSWDPKRSVNSLKVKLAVPKPDDSKYGTVVGQIKIDDSVSKKPLAELFYAKDGTLTIGVSQIFDVSSLKMTEVGHVDVGKAFEYELKYQGGKLSVTIQNGKEQVLGTGNLNSPKSYFKVGNYNQGESPSEVRFYKINVNHG
ncbi:alginate lyase 2 [Phaeosphaeriaceae sp. PMI808]|nr:alginate lyase 2 [Phaeosphaeriaceae sp. PMI808]